MAKRAKKTADRQQGFDFDQAASPSHSNPSPEPVPENLPAQPATEAATEKIVPTSAHSANETIYVLDAYSLIYQVFHAMPEMTSPSGQPVGAVHGFVRDVVDLLQNRKPDYLVVAFDAPGDNFRHQLYESYKANRPEMPVELRPQIPMIQQMLAALNVPVLQLAGFEADDIIATLARMSEETGRDCFLVTADKDCRQLISDRVTIFNIRKNELFDAAALQATWGIRPDQVVDFQTLVGDAVDNVPGVPLIGPKLAQELLAKYGTLEEVFAHVDEVAGAKRKENLRNGQAQALISRELVRLKRDVPLEFDWNSARVGGIDAPAVDRLCREFGFRQLAERLSGLSVKAAPSEWIAKYETVADLATLERLVREMEQAEWLSIDTETTSVYPRHAEIVGISCAWRAGEGYYIPILAPAGEPRLPLSETLERLRPVLENPRVKKLGQNLKYDLIVLRGAGGDVRGVGFDTMVADYLLEPGERSHNLDDLAKRYLNHNNIEIEELIGKGKNQKRMDEVPVALITQYAAEDADVPVRLRSLLQDRLADMELLPLFHDLEMPLVDVLAELEFNGIRIDTSILAQLSQRYGERMRILEEEIYREAGSTLNLNSPKQLATLLFEQLKLPVIKKTQTGASTDAEVLEELAKLHPLPAKLMEFRQLSKLKSGFVDVLPTLLHPRTERIHTSFKQDVAATGRLSSSDPNLQNIPVRADMGREIRSAFIPGYEGWQLLCADYSQIELRVLAHFSQDEELLRAFANEEDIHALVAAQVHNVSREEVTRDMRRIAKTINFGVIYGQSAFGLSKTLDIPQDEAQRFIDAYFAKYQGVDRFMEDTLDTCRRLGYVQTISGRRRPVQGVRDRAARGSKRQRLLPERIAVNSVIQGSAADIIKLAMIRVHRRLQAEQSPAKMLLQIHDELVFEAPLELIPSLRDLVVQEMTSAYELRVPLKVDVKVGSNWADCE